MRLKRLLVYSLTGLLLMSAVTLPADARLDELILPDRPYGPVIAQSFSTQYLVREGDSLWRIAREHGLGTEALLEANNLQNPDVIKPGQILLLPGTSLRHQVRDGENLSAVAALYQVSVSALVRENNLAEPDILLPGQELRIPLAPRGGPVTPVVSWRSLTWPVNGPLTSGFGPRDGGQPHYGIDIAADHGEIIRAADAGRVLFAGPAGTFGLLVILDHGDGLTTYYAHCSRLQVANGDQVNAGEPIARVGNTGRSFGPHLHFEVRWHGQPYDPVLYLTGAGTEI